MHGSPRSHARTVYQPMIAGAVTIVVVAIAVVLSYNADQGLPFIPTHRIYAELPAAANLQPAAEVRIGGARVGQVTAVKAMPAVGSRDKAFVRITLELQPDVSIPVDTTVSVLPASILGAKYVGLTPGNAATKVHPGGTLGLRQARVAVELSDTFNLFDNATLRGLKQTIVGLGNALAGRGGDLNETIADTRRLLPHLDRVLHVVVAHRQDLRGFIRGAAATTGTLAPLSGTIVAMLSHAADTFAAIDRAGPALGQAIDELPATETVTTHALSHLLPVLRDAGNFTRAIRPGSRILKPTTLELARTLDIARAVLRRTPGAIARLPETFSRLGAAAGPLRGALDQLVPAVASIHTALHTIEPAQVHCNVGGIFARNAASALSEGDAVGAWARVVLSGVTVEQTFQAAKHQQDLHLNYYPHENASECEAGNEPYAPGLLIGNPPGLQSTKTPATAPPPGVTKLAQDAGVLGPTTGAGR